MAQDNRIALITGGSSGIGAAIARCFAAQGMRVIITYRDGADKAAEVAGRIAAEGGQCEAMRMDAGSGESIDALFAQIREKYGRLDILINNAGRTYNVSFGELTDETIRRDIDANLTGTMLCSKAAAQLMGDKGWIVNTASIRGIYGSGRPGIMGYCAAKAGVISFTKNLALELAPRVCVNAVCPGFAHTEYLDRNTPGEMKENWLRNIPMHTFVDLDELAKIYLFLCTTREITGVYLPVDGGYTILNR